MPESNFVAGGNSALAPRSIVIAGVFGAVLWFLVALLTRAIEPLGAFHGTGVVALYAAIIPGTLPFVYLIRALAGLRVEQTGSAVAFATGIASLLDGTALVAMPGLYGADPAGAAAAILWGAGVALILGFVMSRAPRR